MCSEDGTELYMSDTGYIRCSSVRSNTAYDDVDKYCHMDKICNCLWDCDNHRPNGYQESEKESFLLSMSMALQMVKAKGKSKWIASLVMELGKQFG